MLIEQALNPLKMVIIHRKPVMDNKMYQWEILTTFNTLYPHGEARLCCSN